MSKFWGFVTLVFVVAIALLAVEFTGDSTSRQNQVDIDFSDLETECRMEPAVNSDIRLNNDNSLSFEGHYPEDQIEADLGYRFRSTSDSVTLNIRSSSQVDNSTFLDDCKASVKYIATTDPLEPGFYTVTVQHNGETVNKQVIRIKGR